MCKAKKQWRVVRKDGKGPSPSKVINPGDKGIWATCNKGREKKCMFELLDLFDEVRGIFSFFTISALTLLYMTILRPIELHITSAYTLCMVSMGIST